MACAFWPGHERHLERTELILGPVYFFFLLPSSFCLDLLYSVSCYNIGHRIETLTAHLKRDGLVTDQPKGQMARHKYSRIRLYHPRDITSSPPVISATLRGARGNTGALRAAQIALIAGVAA